MKFRDQFGNPVSTRSRAALDLFDRAVAQFGVYQIDPLATIDEALAIDPDFVMAHCFKASLLATTSERGCEPGIAAALEAAEGRVGLALARERMHLNALRAWLSRDFAGAVKLYGDISAEHPRDLHALQIAHLFDFLLGNSTMLRDRPVQVLHAWSESDPQRGLVLGMHAFGLEECGAFDAAEAAGRRAMELNPADIWAVHAVTHVLEMRGQTGAGIGWLKETAPAWSERNIFAFHNWWHLALYYLDFRNYEAALEIYDTHIRPTASRVAGEMVDASALLWRLRLQKVDVGDRWANLAASWSEFAEDGYYAFNDVHALMAFLSTGDQRQTQRIMAGLQSAARRTDTNGMMSREVGLPMARALCAIERQDYEIAIDELQGVRAIAQRFGGSHAQRDLLQLTATEAALRAGRRSLARALVAERLAIKPRSEFNGGLLERCQSLNPDEDMCPA
ncbi:MAG TPA: tetratricopeptide repeat protein [Steroidobacteraceae bacterium]|nr:tetratricopeptide repeat protein [Steroidobacteraceae bacterium]